jgi:hypothetical protein
MTKLTYRRWTDERIIEELRGLYDRGVPMTCRGIGEADRVLFQAALYHFGTLKNVLRAARIPWEKGRLWNEEKVIAEIWNLRSKGVDLSASRVTYSNGGLQQAAIKYCGCWKNAMSLAGLAPKEYRRRTVGPKLQWTKKEIIDELNQFKTQGVEMSAKGIGTADYKLYLAAKRHFGTLSGALEKAGIQVVNPPTRSTWTDETVIAEIRRLEESGKDMSSIVAVHNHPELNRAARKHFGTWTNALAKSGIDPERVRKRPHYSDEHLLGELRRLHDMGEPVNATALRKSNNNLANMLRGRFGSHETALRAAGLNPSKIRLR